jgi:hypothetical protein
VAEALAIEPNPACEMARYIRGESGESKGAGPMEQSRKSYLPPISSIQLSTIRQSVMRMGVPWTPVSKRAILIG